MARNHIGPLERQREGGEGEEKEKRKSQNRKTDIVLFITNWKKRGGGRLQIVRITFINKQRKWERKL